VGQLVQPINTVLMESTMTNTNEAKMDIKRAGQPAGEGV
jgi:hypothetical protein